MQTYTHTSHILPIERTKTEKNVTVKNENLPLWVCLSLPHLPLSRQSENYAHTRTFIFYLLLVLLPALFCHSIALFLFSYTLFLCLTFYLIAFRYWADFTFLFYFNCNDGLDGWMDGWIEYVWLVCALSDREGGTRVVMVVVKNEKKKIKVVVCVCVAKPSSFNIPFVNMSDLYLYIFYILDVSDFMFFYEFFEFFEFIEVFKYWKIPITCII